MKSLISFTHSAIKYISRKYWLTILIAIGIVLAIGIFSFFNHLANEDRDFKLSYKLNSLGKQLKDYKKQYGKYPINILQIQNSDQLCVSDLYTQCRKVYYKPSPSLDSFKMATHALTYGILYYDPQYSFSTDEWNNLPKEERGKHKKVCWFCFAYQKGQHGDGYPTYREDKDWFPSPEEWPIL